MAVTQYIGARYVPMFSDPLDWDSTKAYEPLTIVYYLGNSYTSRQSVPTGIDIANTDYWAITGNYNAQIEAYRKEVQAYDGRITENAEAIAAEVARAIAEEKAVKEAATALVEAEAARAKAAEEAEATRAKAAESELATGVSNALTRVSEEATRAEAAEAEIMSVYKRTTKGANVLCIGDSYGRGVGNSDKGWVDYFSECEPTAHVRNISNSGAGFLAAGHSDPYGAITFTGQLQYAASNPESGIANEDVDFVIIAGGWNDNAKDMSDVETATKTTYNTAKSLFPNAEIWIFSLSNELNTLAAAYLNTGISISKACRENGFRTDVSSWYWLKGNRFVESSDGIHPNDEGYKIIGKAIYLAMQGVPVGSHNSNLGYGAATSSIVTSSSFRDVIKNGVVYIDGSVTAKFTSTDTTFMTIPSVYAPRQTLYFMAQFFPSGGTKVVAPVAVLSDGQIGIRTPFGGSLTTGDLYFTIQYPLATL